MTFRQLNSHMQANILATINCKNVPLHDSSHKQIIGSLVFGYQNNEVLLNRLNSKNPRFNSKLNSFFFIINRKAKQPSDQKYCCNYDVVIQSSSGQKEKASWNFGLKRQELEVPPTFSAHYHPRRSQVVQPSSTSHSSSCLSHESVHHQIISIHLYILSYDPNKWEHLPTSKTINLQILLTWNCIYTSSSHPSLTLSTPSLSANKVIHLSY